METPLGARAQSSEAGQPQVSVIIPARNEEACLGACLESLLGQQGISFEILVVNDGSTDSTRQIAESFPGVRVLDAGPLPPGWGGKSNAAFTGAKQARGRWLLFTDADVVHVSGSLARSVREAEQHGAALLSYSPAQELHGLVERAVMPVIFAELAAKYRPREVCDPNCAAAAANGQYLLISRDAYDAVGGHAAIAHQLLEDVELARAVKRAGFALHFRFGGDAARTRMYRNATELVEGWTKNLALLFPHSLSLALLRLLEFLAIFTGLATAAMAFNVGDMRMAAVVAIAVAVLYLNFLLRVAKAHAGLGSTLLSVCGLPIFSYLLLRSRLYYKWRKSVPWKGREYATGVQNPGRTQAESGPATGERWST
jgi:glycosyltransferase involved in cell wall biosynthesis